MDTSGAELVSQQDAILAELERIFEGGSAYSRCVAYNASRLTFSGLNYQEEKAQSKNIRNNETYAWCGQVFVWMAVISTVIFAVFNVFSINQTSQWANSFININVMILFFILVCLVFLFIFYKISGIAHDILSL